MSQEPKNQLAIALSCEIIISSNRRLTTVLKENKIFGGQRYDAVKFLWSTAVHGKKMTISFCGILFRRLCVNTIYEAFSI